MTMSQVYVLLGFPIEHSPSPAMHEAAFAALGIDARYRLRTARLDEAITAVEEIKSGRFGGANVTTPLKTRIAELVPLRGDAARAGAVNTLWWDGSELVGSLTDIAGVCEPLRARGVDVGQGIGLVLGAGGAARAACIALEHLGKAVHVAAREVAAARALLEHLDMGDAGAAVALADTHALSTIVGGIDVIVQATPVGRHGDRLPIPWEVVPRSALAFDMVYAPRRTPFLIEAAARGCPTIEGWEMMVAQGAESFVLWTGREAPRQVMRDAVLARLGPIPAAD